MTELFVLMDGRAYYLWQNATEGLAMPVSGYKRESIVFPGEKKKLNYKWSVPLQLLFMRASTVPPYVACFS